ncbi:MAG: 50S ribosomal protein L21 [Clostridia bacterium]|nr:50S ribosomal protein L21 [Clostridia bacterium]
MFAVIKAGGKQYRVQEGDVIYVEKMNAEVDAVVDFEVLLCGEGDDVTVGTPVVEGAKVEGKVLQQGKGDKIVVFKFKSKKGYRRTTGHRQPFTKVEILKISK